MKFSKGYPDLSFWHISQKTHVVCTQWKFLSRSGPEALKLSSCSTQLSMKFIMLINVKMPTIVGILTLICMINTAYESLQVRKFFIFQHFSFYGQLKFHAQLSMKKIYNLRVRAQVGVVRLLFGRCLFVF